MAQTKTCKQRGYMCCYPDKQTGICPVCGNAPKRATSTPGPAMLTKAMAGK